MGGRQESLGGSQQVLRRGQWHPTPVLLPGKSHGWCGQSSDLGLPDGLPSYLYLSESYVCLIYDAWGFWLYLAGGAGEGNGSPPQCSCLENPRDGGAWWAAVYGVAQSWTRLKRLSSSSSSRPLEALRASPHYSEQTPPQLLLLATGFCSVSVILPTCAHRSFP